jgi:hypothetical protein
LGAVTKRWPSSPWLADFLPLRPTLADPEAVRRAAERNKLPVDRITRVVVLDPYFYR